MKNASGKARRKSVDLPVPRGPNKKKLCSCGGVNDLAKSSHFIHKYGHIVAVSLCLAA
jgi:hypothetical protein